MELVESVVPQCETPDDRRLLSDCWIYTRERGLRAVTMHGNGASIALDGRRLYRWYVMDPERESVVAHVYCADQPSVELQERIARQARVRFHSGISHLRMCADTAEASV
jgi:hypothetical protein